MSTDNIVSPFFHKSLEGPALEEARAQLAALTELFFHIESTRRRQLLVQTCQMMIEAERQEREGRK